MSRIQSPLVIFLEARMDELEEDPWRDADIYWHDSVASEQERFDLDMQRHEWKSFVLADISAKREIIAECSRDIAVHGENDSLRSWRILRHLATPYRDHKDFMEAWR